MATRTYYKVVTTQEARLTGLGLGYEAIYGGEPRYFWDEASAEERAHELNYSARRGPPDELSGTYHVEKRRAYPDGSFDDEDDDYADEQLGWSWRRTANA